MLTLFSKSTTEKGMDSSTSRIILEQSGAVVRQMKLSAGDQLEWQMESINPEVIRVTIIRSERKPSD